MKHNRTYRICLVITLLTASAAWAAEHPGTAAPQSPLEELLAGNIAGDAGPGGLEYAVETPDAVELLQ